MDYIERVKTQQRNWIGRSHGAEINFDTTAGDTLTVYTTRADTLFGATYMVISPEHAFIKKWVDAGLIRNADAVAAYQEEAARKSDFERTELNKEKTGVVVEGVKGINPVNGKQVLVQYSDRLTLYNQQLDEIKSVEQNLLGVRRSVLLRRGAALLVSGSSAAVLAF